VSACDLFYNEKVVVALLRNFAELGCRVSARRQERGVDVVDEEEWLLGGIDGHGGGCAEGTDGSCSPASALDSTLSPVSALGMQSSMRIEESQKEAANGEADGIAGGVVNRMSRSVLVISRSSNFDHLDDLFERTCAELRLRITSRQEITVPGSMLESLHIGPILDDLTTVFVVEPDQDIAF